MDETKCMICQGPELSDENVGAFEGCDTISHCTMRAHAKCVRDYIADRSKRLQCPCGSYFGALPRSSTSRSALLFALLSVFINIDWYIAARYPIYYSTILFAVAVQVYHLISPWVALYLFAPVLTTMALWSFVIFAMRTERIKTFLRGVLAWCRGDESRLSNFEKIMDSALHGRPFYDSVGNLMALVKEIISMANFADSMPAARNYTPFTRTVTQLNSLPEPVVARQVVPPTQDDNAVNEGGVGAPHVIPPQLHTEDGDNMASMINVVFSTILSPINTQTTLLDSGFAMRHPAPRVRTSSTAQQNTEPTTVIYATTPNEDDNTESRSEEDNIEVPNEGDNTFPLTFG